MAEYHLSIRTISAASLESAKGVHDYISRLGAHAHRSHELVFAASGHMPVWAQGGRSAEYWASADLHERKNGRLARVIDFALPTELGEGAQIELARKFCTTVANGPDGPLPYSFAVHYDDPLNPKNPHVHMMFSERINDGIPRSPETWFRRAAVRGKAPDTGGARKATFSTKDDLTFSEKKENCARWVSEIRARWAAMTNAALETNGSAARIDHRSFRERGIKRIPTIHLGAAVCGMAKRGIFTASWRRHESIKKMNAKIEQSEDRADFLIKQIIAQEQIIQDAEREKFFLDQEAAAERAEAQAAQATETAKAEAVAKERAETAKKQALEAEEQAWTALWTVDPTQAEDARKRRLEAARLEFFDPPEPESDPASTLPPLEDLPLPREAEEQEPDPSLPPLEDLPPAKEGSHQEAEDRPAPRRRMR
jgi:hypothetical protein